MAHGRRWVANASATEGRIFGMLRGSTLSVLLACGGRNDGGGVL
jgi:hypothetical protein